MINELIETTLHNSIAYSKANTKERKLLEIKYKLLILKELIGTKELNQVEIKNRH